MVSLYFEASILLFMAMLIHSNCVFVLVVVGSWILCQSGSDLCDARYPL